MSWNKLSTEVYQSTLTTLRLSPSIGWVLLVAAVCLLFELLLWTLGSLLSLLGAVFDEDYAHPTLLCGLYSHSQAQGNENRLRQLCLSILLSRQLGLP